MFSVNICPSDYQLELSSDLRHTLADQLKNYFGETDVKFWQSNEVEMSGVLQDEHLVMCPYCMTTITLQELQKEKLEEMLSTKNADQIEFDMPCCKHHTKLASVSFENSAFSNWGINIHASSRAVIQEFLDSMMTSVPLKLVEPVV